MHPPTSRDVLAAVAAAFEVPPAALPGPGRRADIAHARFAAVALLTDLCRLNTSQIGRRLNRNHATVLHARARAERLQALGGEFAARLEAARAALGERP